MTNDTIKTNVLEGLKNGSMLVVFTKADGTERKMRATLCPSFIPEETRSKEEATRTVSSDSQAVYDLDLSAWRSFRWDRLTEYKGL
jgi:hypothetical protein